MTGPICFARNDLRIEPRHLVAAPGVPKNGRNGSFEGLFRASVHWCTRPRLGRRHGLNAECGVLRPQGLNRSGVLGSVSRIC